MPTIKFDYNKLINGEKDSRLGRLATKLSAVIEESSADISDQFKLIPLLYEESTSDSSAETIVVEDGYGLMDPTYDGNRPKTDKTTEIGKKVVMHIPYTKHIFFTKQMIDDAKGRLRPDMSVKAKELPRSYYQTREVVGQLGYIDGEKEFTEFNGAKIDLTTYDGKPLFSANHTYGKEGAHAFGTQSNLFYVVNPDVNSGNIAEYLAQLAINVRQMKNANGMPMGYAADSIFIPGGVMSAQIQTLARQALGSQFSPSNGNNDINTQYGQFSLNIMPLWDRASKDDAMEIMVMSQDSKSQMRSMFYDRTALSVNAWVDDMTRNLNFSAYSRFGFGHADYKHVVKLKIFKTAPEDTSNMTAL